MENRHQLSDSDSKRQEVSLPWEWRRKLRYYAPWTIESLLPRTHHEEVQKRQKCNCSQVIMGYIKENSKRMDTEWLHVYVLLGHLLESNTGSWREGRAFLLLFWTTLNIGQDQYPSWTESSSKAEFCTCTRCRLRFIWNKREHGKIWNKREHGKFWPIKQTFCQGRSQQQELSTGSESHFLSEEPGKGEVIMWDLELPS